MTFTATISGGSPNVSLGYNWTISAGRITSGQGTPSITVDTTGLAGQTVRASLDISGFGTPCPASCAVSIPIVNKPRKFDEYYDIARNDEKARLDVEPLLRWQAGGPPPHRRRSDTGWAVRTDQPRG